MFNLYFVLSEALPVPVWDNAPYHIAELVIADSYGQAKWLAWKNDQSFTGCVDDMPRFNVRLRLKDMEGPARVVSQEYMTQETWKLWGKEGERFTVYEYLEGAN